jgi:hypothetical protein
LLRRVRWGAVAAMLVVLAWAALAPLRYPTREHSLDFAPGGRAVPASIRLTLGVRDVLLLQNRDAAPHVFGQVRVLPGHLLRLPFEQAGDFVFACDAAPDQAVTVRVAEHPAPGWARLRWRALTLADGLRTLPVQAPDDE